jgi:hypothetical protein
VKADGDVIHYRDRTQAISVGQNRLTVGQRLAGKAAPTYKVVWRLEAPILAVTAPTTSTGIQPAPTVAYTNLANLEFVLHERATQQERKDLLAQMRDLIDEAIITSQINDLDMIW